MVEGWRTKEARPSRSNSIVEQRMTREPSRPRREGLHLIGPCGIRRCNLRGRPDRHTEVVMSLIENDEIRCEPIQLCLQPNLVIDDPMAGHSRVDDLDAVWRDFSEAALEAGRPGVLISND